MSLEETTQPWSAAHRLWAAGYHQVPALPRVHRFCLVLVGFCLASMGFLSSFNVVLTSFLLRGHGLVKARAH